VKHDSLISWPVPPGLVLLLVVGVHKTNRQLPCLVGEILLVIYHRRELFQIKSLTWLLDRTLLVGDSKDTPNKGIAFDLPTSRVCKASLPLVMTDELFHWLAGLGSRMIRRVA
jgi:hypothetical protein